MIVKKVYLEFFFISVSIFFISTALLERFIFGDLFYYRYLYAELPGVGLVDLLSNSVEQISRIEPLSALILWFGAYLGIERNIYISFLNILLVFFLYLFLRKSRVQIHIIALCLTNFYLLVLLTSAERLKIAFIFIFLSLVVRSRLRIVALVASFFCHIQAILFLPSLLLLKFLPRRAIFSRRIYLNRRNLFYFLMVFLFVVFYILLFSSEIYFKLQTYLGLRLEIASFYKLFILHSLLVFLSKSKFKSVMILMPFYPLILFLGDERINMMAFLIFSYSLVLEQNFRGYIVSFLLLYFSFKSMLFLINILEFGNGFYSK